MSHESITNLIESARELISFWEGTLHAEIMRGALESEDYEQLFDAVRQARNAQFDIEYLGANRG